MRHGVSASRGRQGVSPGSGGTLGEVRARIYHPRPTVRFRRQHPRQEFVDGKIDGFAQRAAGVMDPGARRREAHEIPEVLDRGVAPETCDSGTTTPWACSMSAAPPVRCRTGRLWLSPRLRARCPRLPCSCGLPRLDPPRGGLPRRLRTTGSGRRSHRRRRPGRLHARGRAGEISWLPTSVARLENRTNRMHDRDRWRTTLSA